MAGNSKKTIQCRLDAAGVDHVSEIHQERMAGAKVQPKNAIRSRLSMEGFLENLSAHFGGELDVSVEMGKKLGRTYFIVRYEGDAYDPIKAVKEDELTDQLMSYIGMMPTWSFKRGVNELILRLPRNKLRSEFGLLIAFVAALAIGIAKPILPQAVTEVLGGYVLSPLADLFMNLLGTFAGIVVFLCVVSGICGVGNVADFSKKGKYLILRNLGGTFAGAGLCAALMIPFFRFRMGTAGGESQFSSILKLVLNIIPSDPVTPFATGNMLQLVFMAILIGVIIVILDDKAKKVRDILLQAADVAMETIEFVCKLLPIYIFSSLTVMFWENGLSTFKSIWKPLLLTIVFSFLLMGIMLCITSLRCKTSPAKLFRKTFRGFLIGLTTASSAAAYGVVMDENDKALGIAPQLSNFGYPIEMIISTSTIAGGFISVIYFLAEHNSIEVSVMWFITVWILGSIVSVSIPPVSGGSLIGLAILLAQCNISADCLSIAGTLVLLADFFMTATRIVICQMELVQEAKHWGDLDLDKLRS